jgi:hypothetical protein
MHRLKRVGQTKQFLVFQGVGLGVGVILPVNSRPSRLQFMNGNGQERGGCALWREEGRKE